MTETYDITLQVPKKFCGWCNAELVTRNGQYFIRAKPNCRWCLGTGDHNVGTIHKCLDQHIISIGTVERELDD